MCHRPYIGSIAANPTYWPSNRSLLSAYLAHFFNTALFLVHRLKCFHQVTFEMGYTLNVLKISEIRKRSTVCRSPCDQGWLFCFEQRCNAICWKVNERKQTTKTCSLISGTNMLVEKHTHTNNVKSYS